MIDEDKYRQVLTEGLVLDHYFVLCSIKTGVKLLDNKRVQGFVNLLTKKGYIKDDMITDKGLELVGEALVATTESTTLAPGKVIMGMDFKSWVVDLHLKCQSKLTELTGNKQVQAKINKLDKKSYSFLCNVTDLGRALTKCMTSYKLTDYEKMEKTILSYIERSCSDSDYFPLVQYYIIKNGVSQMVTDLDDVGDNLPGFKSTQKFV